MLIGRTPEIKRLEKVYRSKEAEFVVLYGRRRVGKTFLIKHFFW
jgi:AAA+ ATPase superfamily predicted ATPase